MQERMPTPEDAWNWLLAMVPVEWRPMVGLAALIAIVVWAAVKFVATILDLLERVRTFFRRKALESQPIAPKTDLPPPRVSIWNRSVSNPPRPRTREERGIPILTVATMKGGVGKTTLTANLAAHFDRRGKRVLLIDLDYQGSLSHTVLAAAKMSRKASVVDHLIKHDKPIRAVLEDSQSLVGALPNSRILTCYYEFSDTETHEMVDWLNALSSGTATDDLRFRLCELLRDEVIHDSYDLVIIDSPPRFTTGAINAFCASTHLLIPTVLDQMSAEAAVYFSRDIAAMRQNLFPRLDLVGVVPTMTYRQSELTPREESVIDYLNHSLSPFWGGKDTVLKRAFVPRKNAIGDIAGIGIGYIDAGDSGRTSQVRDIFDRVGAAVGEKIDL